MIEKVNLFQQFKQNKQLIALKALGYSRYLKNFITKTSNACCFPGGKKFSTKHHYLKKISLEREADHKSQYSRHVKNAWRCFISYTSCIVLQIINRDGLTCLTQHANQFN